LSPVFVVPDFATKSRSKTRRRRSKWRGKIFGREQKRVTAPLLVRGGFDGEM
jgi:hypothetical protein